MKYNISRILAHTKFCIRIMLNCLVIVGVVLLHLGYHFRFVGIIYSIFGSLKMEILVLP